MAARVKSILASPERVFPPHGKIFRLCRNHIVRVVAALERDEPFVLVRAIDRAGAVGLLSTPVENGCIAAIAKAQVDIGAVHASIPH